MSRTRLAAPLLAAAILVFAVAAFAQILVEKTAPEDGAVVDRPVRDLRVWFNRAPDLDKSSLSLEGPSGELAVVGVHTMGENDLMGRVTGSMPDGEYTARWTAAAEDGQERKGEWSFRIERGR